MAKTDPALIAGAATGELARGSLRLVDAIAISVSVIAPGMAMLLNVTGVSAVSGGSTPLAFLLGGIACLALAFVVIGFTRRMAAAGYAYTYTSRSLGKGAGFMAGWLYFFGMICFVPMTMSGSDTWQPTCSVSVPAGGSRSSSSGWRCSCSCRS